MKKNNIHIIVVVCVLNVVCFAPLFSNDLSQQLGILSQQLRVLSDALKAPKNIDMVPKGSPSTIDELQQSLIVSIERYKEDPLAAVNGLTPASFALLIKRVGDYLAKTKNDVQDKNVYEEIVRFVTNILFLSQNFTEKERITLKSIRNKIDDDDYADITKIVQPLLEKTDLVVFQATMTQNVQNVSAVWNEAQDALVGNMILYVKQQGVSNYMPALGTLYTHIVSTLSAVTKLDFENIADYQKLVSTREKIEETLKTAFNSQQPILKNIYTDLMNNADVKKIQADAQSNIKKLQDEIQSTPSKREENNSKINSIKADTQQAIDAKLKEILLANEGMKKTAQDACKFSKAMVDLEDLALHMSTEAQKICVILEE